MTDTPEARRTRGIVPVASCIENSDRDQRMYEGVYPTCHRHVLCIGGKIGT